MLLLRRLSPLDSGPGREGDEEAGSAFGNFSPLIQVTDVAKPSKLPHFHACEIVVCCAESYQSPTVTKPRMWHCNDCLMQLGIEIPDETT